MDICMDSKSTTIEALPVEILCLIFLFHRDSSETHTFRWIIVSHVCRSWRATALGHATLWNTIDICYPARAKAFLARARHAPPLYIWLPSPRDRIPYDPTTIVVFDTPPPLSLRQREILECLEDPRWHICDIDVGGVYDDVMETLCAVSHASARVQTLRIEKHDDEPEQPLFPAALCGAAFPSINSLTLLGYCLEFASPAYAPSLRELTINLGSSTKNVYDLEPRIVLDLLRGTPRLQRLVLRWVCSRGSTLDPDYEAIQLVDLKYFELADGDAVCLTLLEKLSLPDGCDLDIEAEQFDTDTALSILDLVLNPRPSAQSLTIDFTSRNARVVWTDTATRDISLLVEERGNAGAQFGAVCARVVHKSPAVTSFELGSRLTIASDAWRDVAPAIAAETVHVACSDITVGLWPLLCTTAGACPRMRCLIVEDLDFRPSALDFLRPKRATAAGDVLRAVDTHGLPRSALHMRGCCDIDEQEWMECTRDKTCTYKAK